MEKPPPRENLPRLTPVVMRKPSWASASSSLAKKAMQFFCTRKVGLCLEIHQKRVVAGVRVIGTGQIICLDAAQRRKRLASLQRPGTRIAPDQTPNAAIISSLVSFGERGTLGCGLADTTSAAQRRSDQFIEFGPLLVSLLLCSRRFHLAPQAGSLLCKGLVGGLGLVLLAA